MDQEENRGPETAEIKAKPGFTPIPVPMRIAGRSDSAWRDGIVATAAGNVPRVRSTLGLRDHLGSFLARWGVGRLHYDVPPGLYAVGNPRPDSPVLVTANYKMSFDRLRGVLFGREAWILVLDTRGINVWCAAGKGTFGTEEIVRQVHTTSLARVVSHRLLILPQLGAPGVSAHEVRERCGFRVLYGPVRAADLPAFLHAGLRATPAMRRVRFALRDRVVLIPVELVMGTKFALLLAAVFFLLGGLGQGGYTVAHLGTAGLAGAGMILAAFLGGAVLGPAMLPLLPGRAFALKGAALGLALVGGFFICGRTVTACSSSPWHMAAGVMLVPAITSFVVMNFTGASTYTSLSGVRREMRFAVPGQLAAAAAGTIIWLIGLFAGGGCVA